MTHQPFFVPAVMFLVVAIPLVLRLVPPNPIYGVRTPATMADPGLWYRVNATTGLAVMLASAFYLAVAFLFPYDPVASPERFLVHLGAFAGPLLLSLLAARATGRQR